MILLCVHDVVDLAVRALELPGPEGAHQRPLLLQLVHHAREGVEGALVPPVPVVACQGEVIVAVSVIGEDSTALRMSGYFA